jgi:phosphoenolpyruvate-protein phosphotransferase (PTS system enzyme I)
MTELEGISASPGIAIGSVFLHLDEPPTVPRYEIDGHQVDQELERLTEAVHRATDEIHNLRKHSVPEDKASGVLDSHLLMLGDPEFRSRIEESVKQELLNVEWVLHRSVHELIEKLGSSQDEYLRERTSDIYDVSKRLLGHLMYRERISLADLQQEVILIAHDLLPSDAIAMNKRMVKAIALDAGGKTSHTAILARAFEIPAVLGLSRISRKVSIGDEIIVDGNRGRVIVRPDDKTKKRYLRVQRDWRRREVQLMGLNELPAETTDGKLIFLKANIEVPEEVDALAAHGADGVGLYRSEFLFLKPGHIPDEEEQYNAYSQVLKALRDKPVTIRTLDIGGDKVVPAFNDTGEQNPILGWRAIRFCLSQVDLFKTQLRALFRASVHGNLNIMFPMISGIEELNQAYEVVGEVKEELQREGIPFRGSIKTGIMIEVPSAAITSDILARKADFFSIGTNDLIQYTLAVDRGNEKIAYLYEPFHPGVLRLLKLVIENAHSQGLSVGMCGEMAGDPLSAVILLGLGLDEFSMSAVGIPEVKRIIRSVSIAEAEELTGTVLEMKSYKEIDTYVAEFMKKRFDIDVY